MDFTRRQGSTAWYRGSATPNDCPQGYYIAKMLGIDPTGGTDPKASSVVWIEDRRNFTESCWANLRMGATAQGSAITLFLMFDIQYRQAGQDAWTDWRVGQPAGQATFIAGPCCAPRSFQFRLRARTEQPEGSGGASPNHRYPGPWSLPVSIIFVPGPANSPRSFLPLVAN